MQIVWIIGGLIIGIILFLLLNELLDVYYFGCAGVSSTFMGCWTLGVVIMAFLSVIAKWIIIIGLIIWIISKIAKSGNKTDSNNDR